MKDKQMTEMTKQELGNLLILCFNANMLEDYDVYVALTFNCT
jgi:hypothetical protein